MLRHAEAFSTSAISIINNNNNNANNNNNGMEQQEKGGLRQRHASDHCQQQQQRFVPPPSQFYVGQNLYHKLLQDHSQANLQDFYRNPAFSGFRHAVQQQQQQQHHHQQQQQLQQQHQIARRDHPISKSFDNLSDTFSVSSDESENFIPRIIRPRRRRKKEKVRVLKVGGGENEKVRSKTT